MYEAKVDEEKTEVKQEEKKEEKTEEKTEEEEVSVHSAPLNDSKFVIVSILWSS